MLGGSTGASDPAVYQRRYGYNTWDTLRGLASLQGDRSLCAGRLAGQLQLSSAVSTHGATGEQQRPRAVV